MISYLEKFMTDCGYPTDSVSVLLDAYTKLSKHDNTLNSLISDYESDYNVDYDSAIEKMNAISRMSGVHEYTGALVMYLCFTRGLKSHYDRAGIDRDIYEKTVLDLKYKLDECACVYGVVGTFVAKWFSGFFNLTRFGIDRLQFEIVPLGAEYNKNGLELTPDSRVINVHIPRTGTKLDRESTLLSYRNAARFFSSELGDRPVFVCSSWLLFPRNLEFLRSTSNLFAFINDFDVFALGEYPDYSQVWRLFDTIYDGDPSHLPSDTSLRRAYIDLIKNGEKTGWGKGLFAFKE